MSISGIIMMCVACVGLWGGAFTFLGIMIKANADKEKNSEE